MARARNIKPGFYQNDQLAECSVWARLIFPGLWMLADREGRLEDRPARLKATLLPYDAQNVDKLLGELHLRGFIRRYQIGGSKYIQIVNFCKHQNPHIKEPASTIPAPPPGGADTGPDWDESGARTGQEPDANSSGPADSLLPLTSSLLPHPESPIPHPDSLTPSTPETGPDGFDTFWQAWPKKVARSAAMRAWKKLRPSHELQATILADVAERADSEDWTKEARRYMPHASSYLAGHRWEDERPTGRHHFADKVAANAAEFVNAGGNHDPR